MEVRKKNAVILMVGTVISIPITMAVAWAGTFLDDPGYWVMASVALMLLTGWLMNEADADSVKEVTGFRLLLIQWVIGALPILALLTIGFLCYRTGAYIGLLLIPTWVFWFKKMRQRKVFPEEYSHEAVMEDYLMKEEARADERRLSRRGIWGTHDLDVVDITSDRPDNYFLS